MFNFLLGNYFQIQGPFLLVGIGGTALVAFAATLLFCSRLIRYAQKHLRAVARPDTPETHRAKDFTPTMGGVCIVAGIIIALLLFGLWTPDATMLVLCAVSFCAIGMWDDLAKIRYREGISESKKFMAQLCAALCVVVLWYWLVAPSTVLAIPCAPWLSVDLGPVLYVLWAVWVILCTVNAVNFTDGLDGLAALTLLVNFALFALIAMFIGFFSGALVLCAVGGALLGFLWYNAYPAQLFMGDAGSLALGSLLAMVALISKAELLIPLAGGIFFIEGVSVALQILYFKATGRRLFKMSPIHHHFELMGCPETKITLRFFIVTLILCGLSFYVWLLGRLCG